MCNLKSQGTPKILEENVRQDERSREDLFYQINHESFVAVLLNFQLINSIVIINKLKKKKANRFIFLIF